MACDTHKCKLNKAWSCHQLLDTHNDYRADNIAGNLGKCADPFWEVYPDKVRDMKLTLLEYLQSLGVTVRGGKEAGTEAVMLPQVQVLLDIGSHGFPILPTPASALIKKRKKDLVSVIRQYLGIHYRKCEIFHHDIT